MEDPPNLACFRAGLDAGLREDTELCLDILDIYDLLPGVLPWASPACGQTVPASGLALRITPIGGAR